jgi:AcrR family transcriptional regulator
MPTQNEDLRVRRTRKLLQSAMIDLAIEKGFADLTVRDIAERAMVNRATFYRHYLDKNDLLKQYMDDIYHLLDDLDERQAGVHNNPPDGLVQMYKDVQQHADFFRVMLGPKGDPLFVQRIRQYIERRLRHLLPMEMISIPPGAPPLDLALSYVSSAGVGAMIWWLENNTPYPPEQMAAWMVQLSNADLRTSLPSGSY